MSDFDIFESEIEDLYRKPEEPKVELTIRQAKLIKAWLMRIPIAGNEAMAEQILIPLQKQIEKAEGK